MNTKCEKHENKDTLKPPDILHYEARVKVPIVKKENICIFKKDFPS